MIFFFIFFLVEKQKTNVMKANWYIITIKYDFYNLAIILGNRNNYILGINTCCTRNKLTYRVQLR